MTFFIVIDIAFKAAILVTLVYLVKYVRDLFTCVEIFQGSVKDLDTVNTIYNERITGMELDLAKRKEQTDGR